MSGPAEPTIEFTTSTIIRYARQPSGSHRSSAKRGALCRCRPHPLLVCQALRHSSPARLGSLTGRSGERENGRFHDACIKVAVSLVYCELIKEESLLPPVLP